MKFNFSKVSFSTWLKYDIKYVYRFIDMIKITLTASGNIKTNFKKSMGLRKVI